MKRILVVLLLSSSLVSNAQMEKYCFSLDAINDTLIAVSTQYDSTLTREYLILNPTNKQLYFKFHSEDEVCFIDSKIISYKNLYDDNTKTPSSTLYSYDIFTKEIKQKEFPFSLSFIKLSSKDKKKMYLYTFDKKDHFTLYLDANLNISDKTTCNLDCGGILFGNYLDTVVCTENFDYDKFYFKNVYPSIIKNTNVQIIYFEKDFVVCFSMLSNNNTIYYYNNNTGKVIKKEKLKSFDIKKQNNTYWILGKNKNLFYSKKLLDKPIEIKFADLNSSNLKELSIQ